MGTIRLGKRTDNQTPLIKDFVPLADLNDLVFTGWDIFDDNVYEVAAHAAVLEVPPGFRKTRLARALNPFPTCSSCLSNKR